MNKSKNICARENPKQDLKTEHTILNCFSTISIFRPFTIPFLQHAFVEPVKIMYFDFQEDEMT